MIKNFSSFNYDPTVHQAVSIAKAGLESVRPETLLASAFNYNAILKQLRLDGQKYDLDDYDRIFLLGIGSGTHSAISYLKNVLGSLPTVPFVIDPTAQDTRDSWVSSATKYPTALNAESTAKFLSYGPFSEYDMVIAITDSTANTIINAKSHMPPDQQSKVLQGLYDLGADHDELLTVNIHLAEGRGGDLVQKLTPAKIINFIVSNKLSNNGVPIISSPFVRHPKTHYDAKQIVEKYNLLIKCNIDSCEFISTNTITDPDNTTNPYLQTFLLASPITWLEPMQFLAKEFGLLPQVFNIDKYDSKQISELVLSQSDLHCAINIFPVLDFDLLRKIESAGFGTELYASSGVSTEVAGQVFNSEQPNQAQSILVEFPTFDVGAIALKVA